MTHLPQDLIDRCARAMFDHFRDNPPAGLLQAQVEVFEKKAWWDELTTACLTEAGQWLTESSAPDPKPASDLTARSLHDLRNPNPNPREP